jgi:hypothetical protein
MTSFIPLLMLLGYGYAVYRWSMSDHHRVSRKQKCKERDKSMQLDLPLDSADRNEEKVATAACAGQV